MRNQTEFIYGGDDVTLECRIEGALPGWRYRWFESSGNRWKEVTDITGDTYTMKSLSSFDNKQCWCWAVRDDPPDYSEVSNIVTVKVRAGLNMTLKMRNERKPVHIGENVTLECSIERSFATWRYSWRKWNRTDGIRRLEIGDTFLIRSVTHSDSGAYWCYVLPWVHLSNVFLLTVQVTQKVNLKIKNPKVPFYTGDDVTLECSSDSNLSDWTYRWYHWSEAGMWNELKNFTEDTYTLQSVTQSDGGKYWCYAFTDNPLHYTEFSNAVILTVQVDYSTVNEIRIGLSFLVLIVLLVLVSECFWTRVLSACRSAEGDSEGHKVMRVFE
ncbi:B-cell receptor CD22-like isoform X1 [Polypterus senegalus]|uniref:B-cell receptor CD22-like isoform X1 n=1 Tax=Polypterus senegalus TaxID=55291 RepID=UPI0019647483|nr:B-cell receptor CD22-like isoform X1 [Polypterus senegalus]